MRAPVTLVDYDPSWPEKFEKERDAITDAIGQWIVGSIEHVGSTAIPGLRAKPVIDMMVPVESLATSQPALPVLKELGCEYWPYKAEVMHWLCKPSDAYRTHHLHLIPLTRSLSGIAPSKQESTTYEPSLVCKLLILGCRLLIPDRLLASFGKNDSCFGSISAVIRWFGQSMRG